MKVLKFGGSSVADADRIRKVGAIVRRAWSDGPVVVVVSALAGVTDELVALADLATAAADTGDRVRRLEERHRRTLDELAPEDRGARDILDRTFAELARLVTGVAYIGDCPPAVRDRILATGERLSAPLVAACLRASGVAAEAVDGTEVIRTDSAFGGAAVDLEATREHAAPRLGAPDPHRVPVVTGFIGADPRGATTTLGRGGSDLSATVLGAALDAEAVEIWTDVNGIFTAPPRVVAGARPQPRVSYDEAAELARFGAAVLFTHTVAPVRERGIPVLVRNTFDPEGPATLVDAGPEVPRGARSLASVERAAAFTVRPAEPGGQAAPGVAAVAPRCLVACLAAASGAWTVVTAEADAAAVAAELEASGLVVERLGEASVVAVVGSSLLHQPWVAGRALEALGRRDLPLRAVVSPSEHSVCLVVDRADHARALAILHEALMLAHLAGRAADAARRDAALKGEGHAEPPHPGRRDRRHRDGRSAARPPAA